MHHEIRLSGPVTDDPITEPLIPIPQSLEDYQQCVSALADISTTAAQCFVEMGETCKPRDAKLAEHCEEARKACDKVLAYIIDRSM
jgi:hypothetical protein